MAILAVDLPLAAQGLDLKIGFDFPAPPRPSLSW
jgi:hypothetical protein